MDPGRERESGGRDRNKISKESLITQCCSPSCTAVNSRVDSLTSHHPHTPSINTPTFFPLSLISHTQKKGFTFLSMAHHRLGLLCIVFLTSVFVLAHARIPGVFTGGPWESAHATFYGGSDASGTMGNPPFLFYLFLLPF